MKESPEYMETAHIGVTVAQSSDKAGSIHADHWRGYDELVSIGFKKHSKINYNSNKFGRGTVHTMATRPCASEVSSEGDWQSSEALFGIPVCCTSKPP